MYSNEMPIPKSFIKDICDEFQKHNTILPSDYENINVKKGLRNSDGTGVMAGATLVGNVYGYYMNDGERIPMDGKLLYRGIDVMDIVDNVIAEDRCGFEEVCYLLLFGTLPTIEQLSSFKAILGRAAELPPHFTEDMILKAPGKDIMNKLARAVMALYCYDSNPDDTSLENMFAQSISLTARFPIIIAHAYAAKLHYFDHKSLYLHYPDPNLSVAENFLRSFRSDKKFTPEEVRLLDLCMMLHAEHGGGNNSTFACRVLSSSGTDTYSAIAAAVGALKGPKHGGANIKVTGMFEDIKKNVSDWTDREEVANYLTKILRKEAYDNAGLIYGMGHAVYSISDPRAEVFKEFVKNLSEEKGLSDEYNLYALIEELAPEVIARERKIYKGVSANVDFYSGFVYDMLGLPHELYTPLFAIARIAGWSAHRMEELLNASKIIRPAYISVQPHRDYISLDKR